MRFTPIQRATLPGGPVAYRHTGSGTPLVLIHGWRGSSRHWQDLLDTFADVRGVYAPDLPGHGETPPRRERIDIESLAGLTMGLADLWGLERFDLVGHSFGGAVAAYIAGDWPGRVRKLVITSLGTVRNEVERLALGQAHIQMSRTLNLARPWLDLGRPWLGLVQPWVERIGGQAALSRTIAGAFVRQMPQDEELVRDGVQEFLRADPLSALEIAIASGSPVFFEALKKIVAPTLLVCGAADRIMPVSAAQALADRLPGARLALLADCGHLPMIEQPDAYRRLVREFLVGSD